MFVLFVVIPPTTCFGISTFDVYFDLDFADTYTFLASVDPTSATNSFSAVTSLYSSLSTIKTILIQWDNSTLATTWTQCPTTSPSSVTTCKDAEQLIEGLCSDSSSLPSIQYQCSHYLGCSNEQCGITGNSSITAINVTTISMTASMLFGGLDDSICNSVRSYCWMIRYLLVC